MKNKAIETGKKQNILRRNLPVAAAFVLPVIALILIFMARDIYPFGDEMYLRSDMYHQYATFLKEFQSILKNGDSLLYTWNIGLGTDFMGTYAYYLASPVNWLVCLLPSDHIPEIMACFIIGKSGLMSATMAYYLKKRFGKNTFAITVFGMFYGMSSYMAAYSWNLMWLDCLVLLPLIVLGLERLVRENKVSLYTISLAVCVLSNYYISIMICIFIVLYFLYLIICEKREGKVIRVICRFALYSVLAGGIACILLMPTMYTMLGSASNSFNFPTTIRWYFQFFEMISHAAMNVEPTVLSGYIPNIYCTIGVFMLIPLYLLSQRISLKERIGKSVLAAVFLISFMMNVLTYIWHGFHYPNSLSARQSFIYIFLILVMAYEAFSDIRQYQYWEVGLCFVAGMLVLILLQYFYGDEESYPLSITVLSCVFLTIYFLWLMLEKSQKAPAVLMAVLLMAAAFCEVYINTEATGYSTTNRTSYVSDNEAIESLLEQIDDDGFYRVEKVKRRTKNDGAWSNYMSASLFSSSALASVSDFYDEMGMQSSTNSYSYYGHTPVITAILGVKYELSSSVLDDSLMTLVSSEDTGSGSVMYLYENEYALSLGFAVDGSLIENAYSESSNPFEAQNSFVESACGVSGVFRDITTISGQSVFAYVSGTGRQYIYIKESLESASVTVERDGVIIYSEEFTSLENPQIIELCDVESGDIINVVSTDDEVTDITVITAIMDYDALDEAMALLADEQYEISEFSDTYVSGTITLSEDGYMFTSIPAENGWKVYVDGQEAEYDTYEDAFIMIALSAGTHTVEFKYVPMGLYIGLIISLVCLALFVLCMLLRRAARKKAQIKHIEEEKEAARPLTLEEEVEMQLEELFGDE